MDEKATGANGDARADGLIYTQEFCLLLGRAQRAPMIRRELTDEYVPAGYTPDEVWDALTVIRRSQSNISPDVKRIKGSSLIGWTGMPDSLVASLREIAAHTQRGSLLDQLADEFSSKYFVTQQYVAELLTNLALDAFPSDYESVRGAVLGELPIATDAQRLALNFHRIMNDLDDYADRPYDTTLLVSLYERLTSGVSTMPVLASQHSPLEPFYMLGPTAPSDFDGEALEKVAGIASGRLLDGTEHPVMVSMLVNCQFWHDVIFPRCNNLMGCIASRLYLFRQGFPVFRYVPKIWIIHSWAEGRMRSPRGYMLDEAHAPDGRQGVEWTAYYDTVMRLMLDNVLAMEKTLGARKEANDEAMTDVDRVPGLNTRQVVVLREALADPKREFRISWQRERFGVVYSTARADLARLADAGLLTRAMSGSAYVYRPAPALAFKLERMTRET